MVWDGAMEFKPMNAHDWELLGFDCHDKQGRPTLPRRRVDIPLPPTLDGLHTIALKLSALSEQLHIAAREGAAAKSHRIAVSQASALLDHSRRVFAALGKEWEMQLREADGAAAQGEPLAISHQTRSAE